MAHQTKCPASAGLFFGCFSADDALPGRKCPIDRFLCWVPVMVGKVVESPAALVSVVAGTGALDQVFSGAILESFHLAPMKGCENMVE
jgi:hypothetical protein